MQAQANKVNPAIACRRRSAGRRWSPRAARGFTLIEVLVAAALALILAMVALPAYVGYAQRGKVAEATGALSEWRVRMEQAYQDSRSYPTGSACTQLGPVSGSTRYFTYSCNSDGQAFTLTATGVSSQGMTGFTYTVNEQGARATTASPFGTGTGCWLTKEGESC